MVDALKFFNTAGPCVPDKHYMIDLAERFTDVRRLIDSERYFILHAPRQTGKTTAMLQLTDQLNQEGKYIALYVNIEAGQPWRNNIIELNKTIINELRISAKIYLTKEYQPSQSCHHDINDEFSAFLVNWCLELPKPLVLFMDEIDSLFGDGLLSVLRQLRGGYTRRPRAFPQSLCLIGLRDIRDYRIYSDESKRYIIGGSCFNIKDESLRIRDFTPGQVNRLLQQHTDATGQRFDPEAMQLIFHYSQGQPWLVNALGRALCFGSHAIPREHTVLPEHVDAAVEILIQRRDTHLDQLADKLTEPRVARVIQSILTGEKDNTQAEVEPDDRQYLLDLGLIRQGTLGLEIANPIYREVIPRELTLYDQDTVGQNPAWYVTPVGKLDIDKVIDEYVKFYKENAEVITRRKLYREAAHHLMFMAWLQRIVNGGGRISREYATGMGRLDLCIDFAGERFAFELKLSSPKALERGKTQLADYLNRLSLDKGWLVIFTRGKVIDWDLVGRRERIMENGKQIEIVWF